MSQSSKRRLSTPTLGLVWFGASVSLAEILTGTFFAPLGLERGLAAILVGHIIGCILFWLVAYVSAKTGASAMGAASRSFGHAGSNLFAVANVIQLVGWTAIMVVSGAAAANLLVPMLGEAGWCVVIGALIVLWIAIGVKRMGRAQSMAAILLLILTFVASFAVFGGTPITPSGDEGLSFGAAVEAKKPGAGAAIATVAYFVGSCWMFVIGLGCALFAGSDDIAAVMAQAGMGVVGILVVVLSTVTTTFLDAQSAGVSAESIHPKLNSRVCGVIAAIVGTALAIFAPVSNFEEFLYLIGSVFAPMAAIVIADYFIGHRDRSDVAVDWRNIVLWVLGFALYRVSLVWDIPCGNTLPVMAIIVIVAVAVDKIATKSQVASN